MKEQTELPLDEPVQTLSLEDVLFRSKLVDGIQEIQMVNPGVEIALLDFLRQIKKITFADCLNRDQLKLEIVDVFYKKGLEVRQAVRVVCPFVCDDEDYDIIKNCSRKRKADRCCKVNLVKGNLDFRVKRNTRKIHS